MLDFSAVKDLLNLGFQIANSLTETPEEGYKLFAERWPALSVQEKELLQFKLKDKCNYLIHGDIGMLFPLRDLCCQAIINEIDNDLLKNGSVGKLKLGEGLSKKELAKIFRKLKLSNGILNTYEQIALVLSNVFSLNRETMIKYLKNESLLENTNDLLDGINTGIE